MAERKRHPKLANAFHNILFFLICVVVGAIFGLVIIYKGKADFENNLVAFFLDVLVALLMVFVCIALQVALHELGHMLAARRKGWKFLSFMLFGFVLSRDENGRFRLSKFDIPGAAGQCLMVPPVREDNNYGLKLYNAGGLIANAVFTVAALVIMILLWSRLSFFPAISLVAFVMIGIFILIMNGIPMTLGGLPNDGLNILHIEKDRLGSEIFVTTMRCMGGMQLGKRLSETLDRYVMDGEQIDYANNMHLMMRSLDIGRALDLRDFDKAREMLDDLFAHERQIIGLYRKELAMEKLFLCLVGPHDDAEVKDMLTKDFVAYIKINARFRPSALRLQYALARIYEHDEEKAARIYGQFDKLAAKYYIPGEVISERGLMEYVRDCC